MYFKTGSLYHCITKKIRKLNNKNSFYKWPEFGSQSTAFAIARFVVTDPVSRLFLFYPSSLHLGEFFLPARPCQPAISLWTHPDEFKDSFFSPLQSLNPMAPGLDVHEVSPISSYYSSEWICSCPSVTLSPDQIVLSPIAQCVGICYREVKTPGGMQPLRIQKVALNLIRNHWVLSWLIIPKAE